MKKTFALLCFLCAFIMNATAQTWVGTWATAPQAAVKSKVLYSNTPHSIRQVVKVSLGGEVIRLKLSNIYSSEPVVIRSVYIAHAKDSFGVDAKSAEYLKFHGKYKTVIPAGKAIESDPLKFNLRPLEPHHLLYHERCNQCSLQLRKSTTREPLVHYRWH